MTRRPRSAKPARKSARRARKEGLGVPDTVLGLAAPGCLNEQGLLRVLDHLPAGTSELVCHPGSRDAEIDAAYGWHFHWDEEARALTSALVRESLLRHGIRLIGYREL